MTEQRLDLLDITTNPVDDLLTRILYNCEIVPSITYAVAGNYDCKLDLWLPKDAAGPVPTLIYLHGGGWVSGLRQEFSLLFLPFIEMGFAVANVQYRMGHVSPAPAAVLDCRAALRWVVYNADKYHFDVDRIVTFGHSAGGHLALMTGMLPASAGLDFETPGDNDLERQEAMMRYYAEHEEGKDELNVAAIIAWSGIADVNDLLVGTNKKVYALSWLGTVPYIKEMAKRMSPLTYVRRGLPPMLLIHGDADMVVPYSQAVRLQEALDEAGVSNVLVTIPGGGHVRFKQEEITRIYALIRDLLIGNDLMPAGQRPGGVTD